MARSESRRWIRHLFAGASALVVAFGVSTAPSQAQNAYITNYGSNDVSVIATSTNTVTATIPVGSFPLGVAVTPDGGKVYVTNYGSATVLVIATSNDAVITAIPVGFFPDGVAVTPDGSAVYVANVSSNNVSVI